MLTGMVALRSENILLNTTDTMLSVASPYHESSVHKEVTDDENGIFCGWY